MKVTVEVTPRPPMGPVTFVGNTVFSDRMLGIVGGLTLNKVVSLEELERVRRRVMAFYVSEGYMEVEVSRRAFRGANPKVDDFIFVIEEGSLVF